VSADAAHGASEPAESRAGAVDALGYPAPRDVRRVLRRLRRGHRTGQGADRATDLYVIALALGITIGFVVTSLHRVPVGPWRVGHVPGAASFCLVVAAVLLAAGAATLSLRAVGPVYAGPAVQAWLLATPGDRARWLRRRVAGLAIAAAAVGAIAGVTIAAVGFRLPVGGGHVGDDAVTAAVAAATTFALAMAMVSAQSAARRSGADRARVAGRLIVACGVAAAAVAIITAHTHVGVPVVSAAAALIVSAAVAAAAVLAAVIAGFRGTARVGRLDRATLTAGAALAGSALAATMSADPTFLFGFVEAQRLRMIGRVRPRVIRARGAMPSLLIAETRRLARHVASILLFAAMVGLPYVASIVLTSVPVTLVRVLAGYVAVNGLAVGLRTVCRSPALRRSLGRSDAWLRGVHLVVPALGAAVYVAATAAAGRMYPAALDLVLAVGLVLAALRSATRRPMVYDTAWLVTPLGVVPVGLITQIIRGPDLAVVLAAFFAFVVR
jgi:hypothetical protein